MNKYFVLLLMFVILSSLTYAVKPSTQDTITFGVWNIETPSFDYFKLGEKVNLHFHVFNASGVIKTNKTATCDFHLYNQSSHVIKKQLRFDDQFDFETDDIMGNITQAGGIGVYSYIVQCNDSKEGGYAERSFAVTIGGQEAENKYYLPVVSLLVGLMIIIYLTSLGNYLKDRFVVDKWKIASLCCYLYGILQMFMLCLIAFQYYGYGFTRNLTHMISIHLWSILIFFIISLIYVLLMFFMELWYKNIKEEKDLENGDD